MTINNTATRNKSNRSARKKIPLAQRRKARQFILQALYQWLLAGTKPRLINIWHPLQMPMTNLSFSEKSIS